VECLVLKDEFKQKIKKVIDTEKVIKYKFKIPLIEKPVQ
jgi:hypothetical protein